MESSSLLLGSQLYFLHPNPRINNRTDINPSYPYNKTTPSSPSHRTTLISNCQKMYVPGFTEGSPEAKAANNLHNFFTYIAVKIVTTQLQSYNREAYKDMMEFIGKHSLNDGDKFCADLMRESSHHQTLALRILEVRTAYCKNDFEWDSMKQLAFKNVGERNTKLMRDYVMEGVQSPK